MDFDLSAAEWRRNATDEHAFVEALATRLEKALPNMVEVTRQFAILKKDRHINSIIIKLPDHEFVLLYKKGHGVSTEVAKVARGIRLSKMEVALSHWLEHLSQHIKQLAEKNKDLHASLTKFLFS